MSKVISFTGEHLGHAATVAESEVTLDRLQAILDAAVITAEPDNDGLYVSEGTARPLWVHVDRRWSSWSPTMHRRREASLGADAANRLNGTLILASATILPHLYARSNPSSCSIATRRRSPA